MAEGKVIFVEIVTNLKQDAHKMFVAMNDRGLRLSPVKMLEGYLLSENNHNEVSNELNDLWKEKIIKLKEVEKDGDADFVKNWLRARYAATQWVRRRGSERIDYEMIGEAPQKWLRENHTAIGLYQSTDFEQFIAQEFKLYSSVYIRFKKHMKVFHEAYEHVYYNAHRNFSG